VSGETKASTPALLDGEEDPMRDMLIHRDQVLALNDVLGHWIFSSWMLPTPKAPSTALDGEGCKVNRQDFERMMSLSGESSSI